MMLCVKGKASSATTMCGTIPPVGKFGNGVGPGNFNLFVNNFWPKRDDQKTLPSELLP